MDHLVRNPLDSSNELPDGESEEFIEVSGDRVRFLGPWGVDDPEKNHVTVPFVIEFCHKVKYCLEHGVFLADGGLRDVKDVIKAVAYVADRFDNIVVVRHFTTI